MKIRIVAASVALFSVLPAFAGKQPHLNLAAVKVPTYTVEGDAIIKHDGDRYLNRPLYCRHIYAAVLAGDKPYGILGDEAKILGNLMFGLIRGGKGQWLQNASDITSKYFPGRMEWVIRDAAWGETVVHLEMAPAAQGPGMVAHIRVEGAQEGDQLVWASGAATLEKGSVLWLYDMTRMPGNSKVPLTQRGFVPADCERNETAVDGASWTVQAVSSLPVTRGECSRPTFMEVGDADAWEDPVLLLKSRGFARPVACGSLAISANDDVYWSFLGVDAGIGKPPAEEFTAGWKRMFDLEHRIEVETPDPWLNAAAGDSSIVEDACFRGGVYTHAGMRWSKALLGWRTLYAGTVYGSHDNVKTQALYCFSKQIQESTKTQPQADEKLGLTRQSPQSRFFGKGRIDVYQPPHYDMQSQFFDQVIHAWRWTGDEDLQARLRAPLDLHCQYLQECFDPAGLGIYESYANTWPTDDQWYNGGGTSEETAYAYQAERTALELAEKAGDQAGVVRHRAAADRIRKGFFDLLWDEKEGHPGAYREQGGLKRLHKSGWLYAVFCPIDAGLLTEEQSAEALFYTEWGMEHMSMPYGGEQCWPSNWVPSIWSVRELWAGDDYHLALAYFQTGLPEEGWSLLRGMFPQQMLFGQVPGDMGHPAGGTDFNDCNSTLARAIVEGLFGYRPNYPAGRVVVAPQFPTAWDHASLKTPDCSIAYRQARETTNCEITLIKPAPLEVQIPVRTTGVVSVKVDGSPVSWKAVPGFGRSVVKLDLPLTSAAKVEVKTRDALPVEQAIRLSGETGSPVSLSIPQGPILEFHDPEHVLSGATLEQGRIKGVFSENAGDHLVFGRVQTGEMQQWQLFKIHIVNAAADAEFASKTGVQPSAQSKWETVDMHRQFNGDIGTIYEQKYLSPRPNTCSLRLAIDGYSTWQMALGGPLHPPIVELDKVSSLLGKGGRLAAPNGALFAAPAGSKNIAFTSLWDNWPAKVEVPVHQSGQAVWFLVCGSTNPMQVRIPNAQLLMTYEDGVTEKLDLIPPVNFWTLCPFGGNDYDYQRDAFSLPQVPPTTVQLGKNCRAIVLSWRLRSGVALKSVTLETLSQEVVIGLMGVSVMK